jgi:YD repeat-containing protein
MKKIRIFIIFPIPAIECFRLIACNKTKSYYPFKAKLPIMSPLAPISKNLLIILFLCILFPAIAQQNVKLPEILPPSPSAFAMTRYGGINLGMQTGTAQYNLPIYTLTSRKLSLPVSLSYSSNGIKVDELASRVGMSWALISGGVITRTVYDQPDEKSIRLVPPASFAHTAEFYAFLNQAANTDNNGTDTSPDVFSFNFNGYSGQFILNGGQIVQLTKTNLKIEFNANNQADFGGKFRITTPDGVVYYFAGGANSAESSYSSSIGENCGKSYAVAIDNAWYLTKIVDPSGDNIVLEYAALLPYSYPASITQSRTKSVIGAQRCTTSPQDNGIITTEDTNCETLITTNSVYLTKITASNGNYITFDYISRQDLTYDKLLGAINIFQNGNATAIKSFGFTYTYGSGTTFQNQYSTNNAQLKFRPFLTSVIETAPGVAENHLFSLEYNNIDGLPPRLSYAQDDFGYFNGAANMGLIPKPILAYQQYFSDATADRTPNFSYGQFGMLQKIKYPTGGYDLISYKAPTYTVTELPDPVPLSLYVSGTGADLSTPVTTNSSPLTMTNSQATTINSSFAFNGPQDQEDFHAQVYIYLINTATGQPVYTGFLNSSTRELHALVDLEVGKTYVLRCTSYGQYSIGSARLAYYTQGSVEVTKNKTAAGVIVDFVKTYDPVQNISSLKKYYYSRLSDLTTSSGSVVANPIYIADYFVLQDCTSGGNGNGVISCGTVFPFKTMTSSTINNLYAYSQHHIGFQSVIESFGLNFENGGIEHTYTVEPNTPGEMILGNDIVSSPLSNRGVGKSGLETFSNTFIKTGAVFQSVKQVKTSYKDDSRLSGLLYGYTVRKRYTVLCTASSTPGEEHFAQFDLKRNYIFSSWVYPDTVITTTFGSTGSNSFAETEVTQYDNTVHLLPTQKTVDRSNGKNTLTKYKYPADFASTTPYDQMYNTLHIWSPIVEQQEFLFNPVGNSSTFLQSTQTDYQVWNGNNSLIYPVTISTKTGANNYDARIQFQAYDSQGNVQSVSKVNGPKVCYVYGYGGNYPVAQVTNADYSTVVAALGGAAAVQVFRDNLNPTDAAVKSFLAPLRSSGTLGNALVVTYTYKQLAGVTSTTDAKGETTSYEYDGFQRLSNVKDKDGNIVKHMDYHYQGQ